MVFGKAKGSSDGFGVKIKFCCIRFFVPKFPVFIKSKKFLGIQIDTETLRRHISTDLVSSEDYSKMSRFGSAELALRRAEYPTPETPL